MGFINFLKTIGRGIVKGVKAVVSFLAGTSPVAKVVKIAAVVAVPVAIAAVEIVKVVKRVKENKKPSNVMEQALIHDDDNDMDDSYAKASYRNTVKRISKNIVNDNDRPIDSKKDLMRELKRTCAEIDRETNNPFGDISDREMRMAREEMNRIAKRVRNRKRFA